MILVFMVLMVVDLVCKYLDGSFLYFFYFVDSTRLVGGINELKFLGCYGFDG